MGSKPAAPSRSYPAAPGCPAEPVVATHGLFRPQAAINGRARYCERRSVTATIAADAVVINPHHERRWLILALLGTAPRERGIAFGIYGAIAGAGGAVGLLLGGVLTEYLSWRWCLYVNVVVAVPAVLAAVALLTNQVPAERPRLDVPGAVAVSLGLF